MIILPSGDERMSVLKILRIIERTRPQAVIPYHKMPSAAEVASVIRRPPTSLPSAVTDYMEWRGISLDPVTRKLVRRTVELSDRVQTITVLAKSLYMSRRALGRRFLNQGLPVPSHWLQISRILRATSKLQNSDASLFRVATSLGYPDGFSLSNQMSRPAGHSSAGGARTAGMGMDLRELAGARSPKRRYRRGHRERPAVHRRNRLSRRASRRRPRTPSRRFPLTSKGISTCPLPPPPARKQPRISGSTSSGARYSGARTFPSAYPPSRPRF